MCNELMPTSGVRRLKPGSSFRGKKVAGYCIFVTGGNIG